MKQNPFKIGDRVNVYSTWINAFKNVEIKIIQGEQIHFVYNNIPHSFHWKCARRLKPKKHPRMFWINMNDGARIATCPPCPGASGWICVKEVKIK
jgi:hypothetical protein